MSVHCTPPAQPHGIGHYTLLFQVLTEIACTYSRLLSPDVTLHSTVDVAFGQLIDELSANCKQSLEALKEESYVSYNVEINK